MWCLPQSMHTKNNIVLYRLWLTNPSWLRNQNNISYDAAVSNSKSATPQFIAAKQTAEPVNRPNSPACNSINIQSRSGDQKHEAKRHPHVHKIQERHFPTCKCQTLIWQVCSWSFQRFMQSQHSKILEVISTKYPWPGKRLNQHENGKDYVHHNGLDRWEVCS